MIEENWIKKSLLIFNDIKHYPIYRSMLRSKDISLAYELPLKIAKICELADKLSRLDNISSETVLNLLNKKGTSRLNRVDSLIFELQEEVDASHPVTMEEWRKKIKLAFESGQFDLELSEKLRR